MGEGGQDLGPQEEVQASFENSVASWVCEMPELDPENSRVSPVDFQFKHE